MYDSVPPAKITVHQMNTVTAYIKLLSWHSM